MSDVQELRIVFPNEPPHLSGRAARILLEIVLDAYSDQAVVSGETGMVTLEVEEEAEER
jgi:hypothetical protein